MNDTIAFIINALLSSSVGLFLGSWMEEQEWKKDLAERGLAEYCQTDGRWEWKGECNE